MTNFLNKFPWLSAKLSSQNNFVHEGDIEKLETAVCLESVLEICYQSFAQLIHNRIIREESQKFRLISQKHQRELRQWLPFSLEVESRIEKRIQEYLVNLDPVRLSLSGVVNLSISLAAHKMDIYKYMQRTHSKHHYFFFNRLIEDSLEEMHFLRMEKEFHQKSPAQIQIKIAS